VLGCVLDGMARDTNFLIEIGFPDLAARPHAEATLSADGCQPVRRHDP
jgi:hypothetical protein